jgi:hypothetical protein
MMLFRNIILALFSTALIAGALFFIQGSRNPLCQPALIVGFPDNQAQEIIARILDETGGLPQEDADLDIPDHRRVLLPVADWSIRSAVLQNRNPNFMDNLRQEDSKITYAIDLNITWEDGAQGIVQWASWRYGLVSCPLVISKGSGPTGKIRVIALTPAPVVTQTPTP